MMKINLLFLTLVVFLNTSFATDQKKFSIDKVIVEEISVHDLDINDYLVAKKNKDLVLSNPIKDIIETLDGIIAIGTKIWNVVEKGKPVIYVENLPTLGVIPLVDGATVNFTLENMSSWSIPEYRKFRTTFKNGYGTNVIEFEYIVHYQWNGQFDGQGHYLNGVTVFATRAVALWGYKFDAKSELVAISNHGSILQPVAGATLRMSYKVVTAIKESNIAHVFHITGDGQFISLE